VAIRMKHNPNQPKQKTIFVGPPSPEQKPSLCSRCGQPVGYRYRVYEKHLDKEGNWRIDRGQYEVAHINPADGREIFFCPEPSMLDQLLETLREKERVYENQMGMSEYGATGKKHTVHMERPKLKEADVLFVVCGAKGSLYTTLDSKLVSCSNCLGRMKLSAEFSKIRELDASIKVKTKTETKPLIKEKEKGKPMAQTMKEKVAAARAKAAAGAGAPAAGVALGTATEDEAPMPKATQTGKVKKQAVASGPKTSTPKMLNLCGCGCGAGVKSRFLPGHDAKLHGWIKKLAAGAMDLATVSPFVRDGMFPKAKQGKIKNEKGEMVLVGVAPTVTEEAYLESLKGKGGVAEG